MKHKDNINIPLFEKCNKMFLEILDSSDINDKEKKYRKDKLLNVYKKMLDNNYIDYKYFDIAHEIKSLQFLSQYPNLSIANDRKSKAGCDFSIYNTYYIECVSCSSGNESKNGLDKFRGTGIFDYGKKENIILTRLSQALQEKRNFYDNHILNNSINPEQPYIIFLSMGDLIYGSFPGPYGFILNKLLFGVGHTLLEFDTINNKVLGLKYDYKQNIFNHNNSPIECNYFCNEDNSCISAILFSCADLEELYTKDNTFLFINPLATNKIYAKKFNNIVYWKSCKSENGREIYIPRFKGKNLNENTRKYFF